MILFALPASPTPASFFSIICIGTAIPIANEATTNASHPNVAVFQWLALQRPIRAARLLERVGSLGSSATLVVLSAGSAGSD